MHPDQDKFEKLLERISPAYRRKKLIDELDGIEDADHPEKNRTGYADLFLNALVQAQVQQSLVEALASKTTREVSPCPHCAAQLGPGQQAVTDLAQAEYIASGKWSMVEAYAEQVTKLKDTIEEIDEAEKKAEEIKRTAGTRHGRHGSA